MSDRLLLLLAPIFAGLAGWIVTLAARYLPGHPHLDSTELAVIFALGAAWVLAHVLLLLHGPKARPRTALPVSTAAPPGAKPDVQDIGTPAA